MSQRARIWAARLLGLSLLGLGGASAADAVTTAWSGIVLSVDQAAGRIVVGDMGPMLKNGKSEIARRSVQTTPSTTFVRVKRGAGAVPSGWIGDYTETNLAAPDVKPGEWVTVVVEREKQRLTALKVTVVDMSEP